MIAKRGLFEVSEARQQEWLETNGMGGFASWVHGAMLDLDGNENKGVRQNA